MPNGLRFLFDENIGKRVAARFRADGYDIVSVADVLQGATDQDVLKYAVDGERILVTLDKDFAELVFYSGLTHAGVILVRLQHESSKNIIRVMINILGRLHDIPHVHKKFILISENRIRVR